MGGAPPAGALIIDARGLIVCPGFIDLHTHLREPVFRRRSPSRAAAGRRRRAASPPSAPCPTPEPPQDNPEIIDYVNNEAANAPVRVLPIGCITKGRKGRELADLAALARAGCIGFSDDGSAVPDPDIMRRALEFSREANLPIIEHCEDAALSGEGIMNEGPLARKLGFKGIPNAAEEAVIARDIELARETGGWLHVAHVSTAGSVALIREAKAEGLWVTAEVTPHHLTLTEAAVGNGDTNAKVNPPLRTESERRFRRAPSGFPAGLYHRGIFGARGSRCRCPIARSRSRPRYRERLAKLVKKRAAHPRAAAQRRGAPARGYRQTQTGQAQEGCQTG